MVWHWNCASALCQNSWRTKGVRYYNLPVDSELRRKYQAVLKNENVNWTKQVICSAHWSRGERLSPDDIPDVICTKEQQQKLESLMKVTPSKNLKKKVTCVRRVLEETNEQRTDKTTGKRKAPKERLFGLEHKQPAKKRRKTKSSLEKENVSLEAQNKTLISQNKTLSEKVLEMEKLQQEMKALQEKMKTERDSLEQKAKEMRFVFNKRRFTYDCLKNTEKEFFDMCGLTLTEFDCLFACLIPFLHLIVYPDSAGTREKFKSNNKLLDQRTELLVTLTVARHAVDLVIMAKLVGGSPSTISRVFVAWMVFIRCVLDEVDLKPLPGFIEACLPKVFVDAGYADCGILGDNTETWIAQSENFELNNLTFSHYKNHTTGKVSVWIFPHGALCKCSDAFPGSISDEQLTAQIDALDYCPKGKVVMTDKGFAISDLCHEKGLHHNRPPLKFNYQYDENDISLNFDIATLRIYNENAIGRIRDWSILNKCWPSGRVDLLGICWIALAHIVNMTKKPIGPKEAQDADAQLIRHFNAPGCPIDRGTCC